MSDQTNPAQLKRIRLAVFSFYFAQGLCFSSFASRIPSIKAYFHLDDAAWGTILLMLPIGQICAMTISGLLVSKIGSKKILLVALPCYVLSLITIGLASSQYTLIMSLIFFGACSNFCNIAVNTQGVTAEALYNKSIMSSFHGGWSLAGFVGSLIGLLTINLKLNIVQHYLFMAILIAVLMSLNYKHLQTDIKKARTKKAGEKAKRNKPEGFLYLLGLVAFCGMCSEGAMFDWSGIYFKDVVNVSETIAPLGFTAFMITMATGRFVADKAIQKWGKQRIIQASGILISTGLFIAVIYPHIIVTTIAFMIIGLGVSSIVPTIYSVAGQKTKISTGLALTVVSSISFVGFLLGPPIIGYISDATNLRYSYALIGIFGICITILASRMKIFKETE